MWNAFAGYTDVYGRLPSAEKVRRVRLWIQARNEYEDTENKRIEAETAEKEREAERLRK